MKGTKRGNKGVIAFTRPDRAVIYTHVESEGVPCPQAGRLRWYHTHTRGVRQYERYTARRAPSLVSPAEIQPVRSAHSSRTRELRTPWSAARIAAPCTRRSWDGRGRRSTRRLALRCDEPRGVIRWYTSTPPTGHRGVVQTPEHS